MSNVLFLCFPHSDASEKCEVEEAPCCSEAKYLSSYDLNCQAASDLKYQSSSEIRFQPGSDEKCQSTSDVECSNTTDSQYQGTSDTIYQSVYVMSDQRDECIIATEVNTHACTTHKIFSMKSASFNQQEPILTLTSLCCRCDGSLVQT